MSIEHQSLQFEEARVLMQAHGGLTFRENLQITDIPRDDTFALDAVELIIAQRIMGGTTEPARTFAVGQLRKTLFDKFHSLVGWNMLPTSSALLRPFIDEDTGDVTDVHATYEIGSPTVSKILSVDYGYFLNADFTRKGKSIPAIGKRAIGKPRIIAPVRTATSQEDGTMRAVPKSEIRKAQAGTLGYRR
jgi:hypothetical protein